VSPPVSFPVAQQLTSAGRIIFAARVLGVCASLPLDQASKVCLRTDEFALLHNFLLQRLKILNRLLKVR
jgi:hypothetical protein